MSIELIYCLGLCLQCNHYYAHSIYFNKLNLTDHLDIIFGWISRITGNTLNDAIDNGCETETLERTQGYHWGNRCNWSNSICIQYMFFIRTIQKSINGIYLISIAMVIFYCSRKYYYLESDSSRVSTLFSHILWLKLCKPNRFLIISNGFLCFALSYAFTGNVVHEIIDGTLSQGCLWKQQIVVIISSCITIVAGIMICIVLQVFSSRSC